MSGGNLLHSCRMKLRQHWLARWPIFLIVGALIGACAQAITEVPSSMGKLAVFTLGALTIAWGVRWWYAGADVHDEAVTVRGYLWSRTIAKASIISITN